jgi:ACT domain-containing protein
MKAFERVSVGARRDLLRVLTSPSNLRANVIRQFHERGEDGMVKALTELESDMAGRGRAPKGASRIGGMA